MLHSLIAFSADLIVELSTKKNTQNVKWKEGGAGNAKSQSQDKCLAFMRFSGRSSRIQQ